MGQFDGFFLTENGMLALTVLILAVGAFVGFVGAWTKRSRVKAMEEYEKKQQIGKNKNKKKNKK
jgi:pheromone shutdown protein TraB